MSASTASSEQVQLQRKPWAPRATVSRKGITILTRCLPFYRGFMGRYIHRVRCGWLFEEEEDSYLNTRLVMDMWCGSVGLVNMKAPKIRPRRRNRGGGGELFATPPERGLHCATCEGRAIGAGMTESRMLAGRMLVFSPRW